MLFLKEESGCQWRLVETSEEEALGTEEELKRTEASYNCCTEEPVSSVSIISEDPYALEWDEEDWMPFPETDEELNEEEKASTVTCSYFDSRDGQHGQLQ